MHLALLSRHATWSLLLSLAVACGDDDATGTDGGVDASADSEVSEDSDVPDSDRDAGQSNFAEGPSRGASIAASEDGLILAAANAATDDVTFFDREALTERARVSVGNEPTTVVFHPAGDRAYVVNRGAGTVSEIQGADTDSPSVGSTFDLGGELVNAALSPGGSTLYVADWTGGRLHVVNTASGDATEVAIGGAPYAVCVTNDGDEEEDDETVYVTDFYSRPVNGTREAEDGSRQGRVFRLDAAGALQGEITLSPIDVTGVEEAIDAANTSAFPNQLYGCAISDTHLHVTSVGASPAPFNNGTDFRQNVHGLMHAVALDTNAEVPERTVNLSQLVAALDAPKRFVGVPASVAFVPGTEFAYIASMNSNSVLRVSFETLPAVAGSPSGASFLEAGASPTGIAISGPNAYTYNEVGRSITHIDLASQTTAALNVESAPQPSDAGEVEELLGQRFFNTGLARWSSNGWVGCVACHPGGTTDNVTWVFPAGPRQTVDTSATFDVSGSRQRILNWTAIFDEVHDFELNTRAVAGGVGAIVSDPGLDAANRINFVGEGGPGDPENAFNVGSSRAVSLSGALPEDWDAIEAYIRTIRTPLVAPQGDVAAGRAVFMEARCQNCHGGELWTLSERYYTPILGGDLRTLTLAEAGVASVGDVRADQLRTTDTGAMNVLENDANGAPQRHSCVVRNVGTFDADGPGGRGANELRENGGNAQGVDGFNVPSLLNAGLGGPYLHNGAAETLEELLDPEGEFGSHLRAGNQVLSLNDTQVRDLVAFVRSIDDRTEVIPVPDGQRFCPEGVVPPTE